MESASAAASIRAYSRGAATTIHFDLLRCTSNGKYRQWWRGRRCRRRLRPSSSPSSSSLQAFPRDLHLATDIGTMSPSGARPPGLGCRDPPGKSRSHRRTRRSLREPVGGPAVCSAPSDSRATRQLRASAFSRSPDRHDRLGERARHDVLGCDSVVRDVVISRPASFRVGVANCSHPSRDAPEVVVPGRLRRLWNADILGRCATQIDRMENEER